MTVLVSNICISNSHISNSYLNRELSQSGLRDPERHSHMHALVHPSGTPVVLLRKRLQFDREDTRSCPTRWTLRQVRNLSLLLAVDFIDIAL